MLKLSRLLISRDILPLSRIETALILSRNVANKSSTALSEDEICDALFPQKAPNYGQEFKFTYSNIPPKIKPDVVISCKNKVLNHVRNQKYDKFKPVPLASKGWSHYKSKGDYFTIRITKEKDYVTGLFWDEDAKDFNNFGLSNEVVESLSALNISKPTKIQSLAIPKLLTGKNALVTAETGCGKTLAYLLPVLQQILNIKSRINPANREYNQPLALILAPSRDLALQIGEVAVKLSLLLPIRCDILVGGRTKKKLLNPKFQEVDLQIASVGVFSKLVSAGMYDLSNIAHVVLDESDTLLDDSFNEKVVSLLKKIRIRFGPTKAYGYDGSQLSLVSATIPTSIYSILQDIVELDSLERITTERVHQVLPHVPQTFYRLGPSQKPEKLLELVQESIKRKEQVMIFSNKAKTSDWASLYLNENGIKCDNLNAAMNRALRLGKFQRFQNGEFDVLSCTDIASRGLDTINVKHIINLEFPLYMADYIHRCGRTGRIGSAHQCRISNFISSERTVEMVKKIEMAVRMMESLPNVNGNINRIIHFKNEKPKK